MARSSDIRIFIAKKFPTVSLDRIHFELHSLIISMESAKQAEGYKPEYGTSFQNEWLKDTVHIKPGKKVAFVSGKVSFTEKSIYQFLEELSVMRHLDKTGGMTFLDMYSVVPLDDVKDIMSSSEIAGLNAEVYATLMKRWYNRHRDGANNSTVIQRRLRSVDAHLEVQLDKFIFHQDLHTMSFDVRYNGKVAPYIFHVPDYGFDEKDPQSKKLRLYHRDAERYVTAASDRFSSTVNKISHHTAMEAKYIAHSLREIIGRVVSSIASASKDVISVEGYHPKFSIKAYWTSTPSGAEVLLNVRNKEASPYSAGISITHDLTSFIISMNKYKGEFLEEELFDVTETLNRCVNGEFLVVYGSLLPAELTDLTYETIPNQSSEEFLTLRATYHHPLQDARYSFCCSGKYSHKLLLGSVSREEVSLMRSVCEPTMVEPEELISPKPGILKRIRSYFKK